MCVVMHTCNPSTWEAETGGLRVQRQHSETLPQDIQEWGQRLWHWNKYRHANQCNEMKSPEADLITYNQLI
jgi:hypothetical protein